MGFLGRLFGRDSSSVATATPTEAPLCQHGDLAPRWDNNADMGKPDMVSSFRCNSCGETFTAEEGRRMQMDANSRLKQTLG